MFAYSKVKLIDLSSFDVSKDNLAWVFHSLSANIGYAKTEKDAGKLNNSNKKSPDLAFLVKSWIDKEQPATFIPNNYTLAKQIDFKFIVDKNSPGIYNGINGYYKYIGEDERIVIPHLINGNEITDYHKMFTKSNVLDLRNFDTSNVVNMSRMFHLSISDNVELTSFNTHKVNDMHYMFKDSIMTIIDLSSFDIVKPNTTWMFKNAKATTGYAKNYSRC